MRGHYLWCIIKTLSHFCAYKVGCAPPGDWRKQDRDSEMKDNFIPETCEINTLVQGSIMGWTVMQRVDVRLQGTSHALVIYLESPGDYQGSRNNQRLLMQQKISRILPA